MLVTEEPRRGAGETALAPGAAQGEREETHRNIGELEPGKRPFHGWVCQVSFIVLVQLNSDLQRPCLHPG